MQHISHTLQFAVNKVGLDEDDVEFYRANSRVETVVGKAVVVPAMGINSFASSVDKEVVDDVLYITRAPETFSSIQEFNDFAIEAFIEYLSEDDEETGVDESLIREVRRSNPHASQIRSIENEINDLEEQVEQVRSVRRNVNRIVTGNALNDLIESGKYTRFWHENGCFIGKTTEVEVEGHNFGTYKVVIHPDRPTAFVMDDALHHPHVNRNRTNRRLSDGLPVREMCSGTTYNEIRESIRNKNLRAAFLLAYEHLNHYNEGSAYRTINQSLELNND